MKICQPMFHVRVEVIYYEANIVKDEDTADDGRISPPSTRKTR